jgi:thiol:disulfide interchange protein
MKLVRVLARAAALGMLVGLLLAGCAHRAPSGAVPVVDGQPQIYDVRAAGEAQLAAALARAQRENKRVLLDLGASWCRDCQAMYRLLHHDPEITRELDRHYVLVMVDVSRKGDAPRNASLVARLGDPLSRGIPVLLVLSSDGTLLNADPAERLADSDHEFPAKVLAYLKMWAGNPQ